ncbi:bile acid:sodium symporter family protein [Desulfocurvibacter africanus]|uniref:bile acid:sodium symporter family protein n=1 Tax=Desulfocurvibacter africanus TaxID=873 RepID=UPI002FD91C4C
MFASVAVAIERLFLPIALLFSAVALWRPEAFTWIAPHIPVGLGIIMFGMGLTQDVGDFTAAARQWKAVTLGAFLQFSIMPLMALTLAWLLRLPPEAALGLVIVGACPGGTASNVIVYLGRGNVPLSVLMTTVSTLLAPLATPGIVWLLLGERIDVPLASMVRSVASIVLFPVLAGLFVRSRGRTLARHALERVVRVFPAISILTISAIIACVIGLNRTTLLGFPALVILAVLLHNGLGFGLGYFGGRLAGLSVRDARTMGVEVGMQNSGLGVTLAMRYFGAAVALPGAIFSLAQNLTGIVWIKFWKAIPRQDKPA